MMLEITTLMDYTLARYLESFNRAEEMALDLTKVASQVGGMIASLKAGVDERRRHLKSALEVASGEAIDLDKLKRKIVASKTTWLVAELVDGLALHYEVPPLPPEFTVMATDGSHIDVDRHRSIRCFLINIGTIVLHYGAHPEALLDSSPHLYADEEMVIAPPGVKGREQPIEGALLGIKRAVEECRQLAERAAEMPEGSKSLALLDGSLILWGLETKAYPDFVAKALLDNGFLKYLDEMRRLNKERRFTVAGYISLPRSTDVVNVLRVALCPHETIDSDRDCPECRKRECDAVSGVRDRELFASLLGGGERSALFISPSRVLRRYGKHQIYFFYIKLDDEVVRVEIPQWVAVNDDLLNLTHTLILDQCRRGDGYPVVLSEAHEQAVVTGADREYFWQLVEASLVDERMPTFTSAKSFSKRMRWV